MHWIAIETSKCQNCHSPDISSFLRPCTICSQINIYSACLAASCESVVDAKKYIYQIIMLFRNSIAQMIVRDPTPADLSSCHHFGPEKTFTTKHIHEFYVHHVSRPVIWRHRPNASLFVQYTRTNRIASCDTMFQS